MNRIPRLEEDGSRHLSFLILDQFSMLCLAAAMDYMHTVGIDNIAAAEQALLDYGTEQLSDIEGMRFIGTAKKKASVISFLLGDVHPYDAGTILDKLGIAVRTGHHCTEPLMNRLSKMVPAS